MNFIRALTIYMYYTLYSYLFTKILHSPGHSGHLWWREEPSLNVVTAAKARPRLTWLLPFTDDLTQPRGITSFKYQHVQTHTTSMGIQISIHVCHEYSMDKAFQTNICYNTKYQYNGIFEYITIVFFFIVFFFYQKIIFFGSKGLPYSNFCLLFPMPPTD